MKPTLGLLLCAALLSLTWSCQTLTPEDGQDAGQDGSGSSIDLVLELPGWPDGGDVGGLDTLPDTLEGEDLTNPGELHMDDAPDADPGLDQGSPEDTLPDAALDAPSQDICQPQCDGLECGDDGCGGSCGGCPEGSCEGQTWTPAGQCQEGFCVAPEPVFCLDYIPCTVDYCDQVLGCQFAPLQDTFCRPAFQVDYPPRAASILGDGELPQVTVSGTVVSPLGAITSLLINGQATPVDPASGTFQLTLPVSVGTNTLVLEAKDEAGNSGADLRSFLWSTSYLQPDPTTEEAGLLLPGEVAWISAQAFDDQDHSAPANDLATLFEAVLGTWDIQPAFPDPLMSNLAFWGQGIYAARLTDFQYQQVTAVLNTTNSGLQLVAIFEQATGSLPLSKTACGAAFPEPCFGPNSILGDLSLDALEVRADLNVTVDSAHTVQVAVSGVTVSLVGLSLDLDTPFADLLNILMLGLPNTLQASVSAAFQQGIAPALADLLRQTLQSLAWNFTTRIDKPDGSLDPLSGEPIGVQIQVVSDFQAATFTKDQGANLSFRSRALPQLFTSPRSQELEPILGVPARVGCNQPPSPPTAPALTPIEQVLVLDLVNEALFVAWAGGLLDFPVPEALLVGLDQVMPWLTDLALEFQTLLPPLLSDCNPDGALRLQVGQVNILATGRIFGEPFSTTTRAALELDATWAQCSDGLVLQTGEIFIVQAVTEQSNDGTLTAEAMLNHLAQTALLPALTARLATTPLLKFPVPHPLVVMGSAGTVAIQPAPVAEPPAPNYEAGQATLFSAFAPFVLE
jgi:hypothetical protein